MKRKTNNVAFGAMYIALAFIFSYIESMLGFNIGVPGVKLGIANIVILTVLYVDNIRMTIMVSIVRIVLSGMIFTGMASMIYSLAGGILSLVVMIVVKKYVKLSMLGVSVAGACAHNLGQILVAWILMGKNGLIYYVPILIVAGIITGILTGIISGITVPRLEKISKNNIYY